MGRLVRQLVLPGGGLRTFVRGRQATLEKEVRTSSQLRSILALTDEEIAAVFG